MNPNSDRLFTQPDQLDIPFMGVSALRITNNSTRGDDEEGREELGHNYSSQISQSSSVR